MILNRSTALFFIMVSFFSCKKEKISFEPFEVNKNIDCNVLYKNGFKRTFGIDVIMIGKIMGDSIIHYEIDIPVKEYSESDLSEFNKQIELKKDSITVKEINKFLKVDALTLNDSIYEMVWGNINIQKKNICEEGKVSWRNFMLKIKKEEAEAYRYSIDTSKFQVLNIPDVNDIDNFNVINLISKDTFYCSVYEQNQQYYFSSTISFIDYE